MVYFQERHQQSDYPPVRDVRSYNQDRNSFRINISKISRTTIAELTFLVSMLFVLDFFQPRFVSDGISALTDLDLNDRISGRAGGNLFNAVKWLAIFGVASILLATDPKRVGRFARLCWPILLIVALSFISVMWSVDPGATFKRAVRAMIPIYAMIVAVAFLDEPIRVLVLKYIAFSMLLFLNLVGLAIPGTFDAQGFYTGTATSKNGVGAIAAMAIMYGLCASLWLQSARFRQLNLLYLLGWTTVLILTVSKTSIALTVFIPTLVFFVDALGRLLKIGVGVLILAALTMLGVLIGIGLFTFGQTPLEALGMSHVTFTGRTDIWDFMLGALEGRWFTGYGYGAFWGIGGSSPNLTARIEYIWYLDSAHNGYLDFVAQLGLLGVVAGLLLIYHFSMAANKVILMEPKLYRTVWLLIIFVLAHNMLESSFFRETPLWHVFLASVLVTLKYVQYYVLRP